MNSGVSAVTWLAFHYRMCYEFAVIATALVSLACNDSKAADTAASLPPNEPAVQLYYFGGHISGSHYETGRYLKSYHNTSTQYSCRSPHRKTIGVASKAYFMFVARSSVCMQ